MGTVTARLIGRYGNDMTLVHNGQKRAIRAFLQNSRSKSRENARREMLPFGEADGGLFVYLGPAEPAAVRGDQLVWQGRQFVLRRAEPVTVENRVVYTWGLCVEKGGEGSWVN